ncbi:putative 60s ribosomal protein l37 protein [Podospora conica]|nr:putative 60s ribosomal protein l37 protein [Schizothecium conicum]
MARSVSPTKQAPSASTQQRAAKVLRALDDLQSNHEITIIKISEPITALAAENHQNKALRTSDVSNSSLDAPTPASLDADLDHYRELFAKLRFSYVEQVTKEKFIRAIVGDPPLIVTPQENADLEASNAEAKAALKALKTDVADMVTELEARARDLAARYEAVQLDTATLRDLPTATATLETAIAELKAAQLQPGGEQPELNMPLAKTVALAETRRAELRELDRALEQLSAQAPRKRKEVERLQAEMAQLEARRTNSTAAAREAKRKREAAQERGGGVADDLEAKGRWYRATETVLKDILDIQG